MAAHIAEASAAITAHSVSPLAATDEAASIDCLPDDVLVAVLLLLPQLER